MSVGKNLQEMENVVTKGAAPAEPMQSGNASGVMTPGQTGTWEDLGGPTPQNYRPDDDSAKIKDPAATLAQVRDVVNAKAAKAAVAKEDLEYEEDEELLEASKKEEEEEEEEEGGKAPTKSSGKKKEEEGEEEEEEEVEEEFSIEEDVKALLEGEDLSEEFQEKAKIIFEAAIRAKVADIKEQLQASYEEALIEEVQSIKNELVERVDAYLEYVADEWIQENALAIEDGLKTEMTESFLQGMKQLFEEHYVSIPEERYDVLEGMVEKLDEMETKLNEQIEKNIALNQRLAESVADVIFAEVTEGLALSQKDKLASLAENVEFDGEENYREKLVTLRESYFPSRVASTQRNEAETLSEGYSYEQPEVSGIMEAYLQTLSRVSKK
jgi:hypothetical protein